MPKPGDYIKARYKTGEYIAKYVNERNEKMSVIEVLAVSKHPTQGDLHNPNVADVPLFHQRRALAHHEKAVVQTASLKTYDGELPDYQASLRAALMKEMDRIQERDDEWAEKAEAQLKDLASDYFDG